MLQNTLQNHISLIVDASGSMQGRPVEDVFDAQLQRLKQRSVDMNQETRISVYLFNSKVECRAFDMDVMRFSTLKDQYRTGGQTALIDAVLKSIRDHKELPALYGDHAHLQYVITDGEENASKANATTLKTVIDLLEENWTIGCMVPNALGQFEAKKYGFSAESIAIWDTAANFEGVGKKFNNAIDNYMTMRSQGIRGTRSLFTLDSSGLSPNNTRALTKVGLVPLSPLSYDILPVRKEAPIKEYIEQWTGRPYVLGSAYYEPTKKVKIQDHKHILLWRAKDGVIFEGDAIRTLLGLPPQTVEVDPGQHKDWRIFVQSTSTNRKLFAGTFLLIRK